MARVLLKTIRPHVKLYRDEATGLAWVENGEAGICHSCHPNIRGGRFIVARARQLYGDKSRLKCVRGFIYNISSLVVSDDLDELARKNCQCGGVHSF